MATKDPTEPHWTCMQCGKRFKLRPGETPPTICKKCDGEKPSIEAPLAFEELAAAVEAGQSPEAQPVAPAGPIVFKPVSEITPAQKEAAIAAAAEQYGKAIGPAPSGGSIFLDMLACGAMLLLVSFGIACVSGLGRSFNWELAGFLWSLAIFSALFGLLTAIARRLSDIVNELRKRE